MMKSEIIERPKPLDNVEREIRDRKRAENPLPHMDDFLSKKRTLAEVGNFKALSQGVEDLVCFDELKDHPVLAKQCKENGWAEKDCYVLVEYDPRLHVWKDPELLHLDPGGTFNSRQPKIPVLISGYHRTNRRMIPPQRVFGSA